jgi:hypothetical protein
MPRRRKWPLRALTTAILTAGSLTALAAPAQAYDEAKCAAVYGEGNVADVDPVWIDTQYVDFGDQPHSGAGGGEPQAKAVICWANDGRVAVLGQGFYDSPTPGQGNAYFVYWAVSKDRTIVKSRSFNFAGSPGVLTSSEVHHLFPTTTQPLVRVSIALMIGGTYPYTQVHWSQYDRGD